MVSAASALRVEPHGQPADSDQWPAPLRYDTGGYLAKRGQRTGGTPQPLHTSMKPAELAQARIFKSTLQDELARLNKLASRLVGASLHSKAPGSGHDHRELADINACIDEVRRLLEALRGRFGSAD